MVDKYTKSYQLWFINLPKIHKVLVDSLPNLQSANHVKGNQMLLTNLLRLPQNCLLCLFFFLFFKKHYKTLLRTESKQLILWNHLNPYKFII